MEVAEIEINKDAEGRVAQIKIVRAIAICWIFLMFFNAWLQLAQFLV